MPAFDVDYLDGQGKRRKDVIFASDSRHLEETIERRGLYLVAAEMREAATARRRGVARGGRRLRLRPGEVKAIFDQLEMLLKNNVAANEGVQSLADGYPDGKERWVLEAIADSLRSGGSLGNACSLFPEIFPPHVVQTLTVAEAKGRLPQSVKMVCEYFTSVAALKSAIWTAVLYPIVIGAAFLGLIGFLVFYAVPKVWDVFTDLGFSVPSYALWFFKGALAANSHPVLFAATIVAVVAGGYSLVRASSVRRRLDAVWLRVPVLRSLVRCVSIARFCTNFAMLYGGLGEVAVALKMCAGVSGNRVYDKSLERMSEAVADGSDLHAALRREGLYSPIVYTTVRVGESNGGLEEAMLRLGSFYSGEAKQQVERLLKMIEPVCLGVLGAFVIFVIVCVVLPFYQQASSLSGM